jgi:hypothetical protein
MHAIARICFKGGMLMLPSRTPYEIETVLENLAWHTARDREVELNIDWHHWRVEYGTVPDGAGCARCCHARAALTFVNGIRVPVCRSCARLAVGSGFAHWPCPELSRISVHGD